MKQKLKNSKTHTDEHKINLGCDITQILSHNIHTQPSHIGYAQ